MTSSPSTIHYGVWDLKIKNTVEQLSIMSYLRIEM